MELKRLLLIVLPLMLAACSLIDDDLSVCGVDQPINYVLQLHTNISAQLQAELSAENEVPAREALERWLVPIFPDKNIDVDLRFYDKQNDELTFSRQEILQNNRTSITLTLPRDSFMHLAVANVANARQVYMQDDDHSANMYLKLPDTPIMDGLNSGIFTARLPIDVTDSIRDIEVILNLITSSVAVVIDTISCPQMLGISGYMDGSAGGFGVRDSIFMYDSSPSIRFEQVPIEAATSSPARKATVSTGSPYICQATACFATPDDEEWKISMTTTLTDNRHTTTTLTIKESLTAGTLRILKLQMNEDGGLVPVSTSEVGASIELDWKKGNDQEIEI